MQVVDRLLTNVAVSSDQDLSLTTPNLALKIVALHNETTGQPVVIPTAEEDVVRVQFRIQLNCVGLCEVIFYINLHRGKFYKKMFIHKKCD